MSEFKDSEGRKWRINLTLGGVKKVMTELGINLLDLTQFADTSDGSATLKLVNDDLFVGEIVAILLEKQAEGYGLKREDVLDLFDGSTTPQNFITISNSSGTASYQLKTSVTFDAGKVYTYNLTVYSSVITLQSTSITDWVDGGATSDTVTI